MSEREPDSSVGWSTRLAFGVGALGEGTVLGASHVFLLFYYNHVLGLSGGLAGAALGVATVIDALTDPLVGSLSDGTHSRFGRRHPLMYGSLLPSALLFYLLFNPPTGLGETTLFLWLTLTASGTRAALTLFSIPHMSMGAELSTDYDERTKLASARGFFRQAGTLTVALVGFGVFFQAGNGFENGQLNPEAYPPFSLFVVACLVTTLLISAAGTHNKIPLLPKATGANERFRFARLLRELGEATRIRSFRYLILSLLTYNSIMGMHGALALYVVTFFWVVKPTDIMFIAPASMLGNVVGASLGSFFTRLLREKRTAAMLGIAWYAVWSSSMPTLRLLGLAPLHGDPWLVPLITITLLIGGLGFGVAIVAKNAMLADITDEHEQRYGARQEGIYYSSSYFAEKAVTGIGIVLAGLTLQYLGLERSATPETVPASVVQGLGILFGPATLVVLFVPIALLFGYDITRTRHAEIRNAIDRRG